MYICYIHIAEPFITRYTITDIWSDLRQWFEGCKWDSRNRILLQNIKNRNQQLLSNVLVYLNGELRWFVVVNKEFLVIWLVFWKLILTSYKKWFLFQKEAYYFNKPCVILRSETEWVEIVEEGAAIVANADEDKIIQSYNKLKNMNTRIFPLIFGDGKAAEFICKTLLRSA